MNFEEYTQSDEGKKCLAEVKKCSARMKAAAVAMSIAVIAAGALCLPLEFFSDEAIEESSFLSAYAIVAFCLAALTLIGTAVMLGRNARLNAACERRLAKAVNLFWRDTPVDWDAFVKGGELLLNLERVFPEGYGAPKHADLQSLVITGGEGRLALDMSLWNGAVSANLPTLVACSLLPYLRHREERGAPFTAVRITETFKGKKVNPKKDGWIVKKGKLTLSGKEQLKRAERIVSQV